MARNISKAFFWPVVIGIVFGPLVSFLDLFSALPNSALPLYLRWGLGSVSVVIFALLLFDPKARKGVEDYNSRAAAKPRVAGWRAYLPTETDPYLDRRITALALVAWLMGAAAILLGNESKAILPFICFALCTLMAMATVPAVPPHDEPAPDRPKSKWSFDLFSGD